MIMLSIYAAAAALFMFFARYFFGVSESMGDGGTIMAIVGILCIAIAGFIGIVFMYKIASYGIL